MSLWNIQMSWIKHLCHFHSLMVCPSLQSVSSFPPMSRVTARLPAAVPFNPQPWPSLPFLSPSACLPSPYHVYVILFHWKTNCKCIRLVWLSVCERVCDVSVCVCGVSVYVYLRMFQFLYWKLTKFAKRWEKVHEICMAGQNKGSVEEWGDRERDNKTETHKSK